MATYPYVLIAGKPMPRLRVRFLGPDGTGTRPCDCIVDSGAWTTLLPARWFRPWYDANKSTAVAVAGSAAAKPGTIDIRGVPAQVRATLPDGSELLLPAYISEQTTEGLLGQNGFFQLRGVLFKHFAHRPGQRSEFVLFRAPKS